MITLTQAAIQHIQSIRPQDKPYLRVGVRGGGCSGLNYMIEFVDTVDPKDKQFDFDQNVKVVVDTKSYLFLNGVEIDYKVDIMKSGFEFNNPMAKRTCSCGESFTT